MQTTQFVKILDIDNRELIYNNHVQYLGFTFSFDQEDDTGVIITIYLCMCLSGVQNRLAYNAK